MLVVVLVVMMMVVEVVVEGEGVWSDGGQLPSRPAVEAFREALGLLVLERQEELAWLLRLLHPQVLYVHLRKR